MPFPVHTETNSKLDYIRTVAFHHTVYWEISLPSSTLARMFSVILTFSQAKPFGVMPGTGMSIEIGVKGRLKVSWSTPQVQSHTDFNAQFLTNVGKSHWTLNSQNID